MMKKIRHEHCILHDHFFIKLPSVQSIILFRGGNFHFYKKFKQDMMYANTPFLLVGMTLFSLMTAAAACSKMMLRVTVTQHHVS
jgi:hypothetical protein